MGTYFSAISPFLEGVSICNCRPRLSPILFNTLQKTVTDVKIESMPRSSYDVFMHASDCGTFYG
jgi:hypothetical protein